MSEFTGIISALVTPFAQDGSLDLDGLRANVRQQMASGVRSFCPLGGTGEPISMTADERHQVVDVVLAETAGKARVVVGCLLPSQAEIFELGSYAKKAGADAIMVIPPYFVGTRPSHARRHFQDIASHTGMPMILFNGPSRAGVKLEAEVVIELAEAIPAFVGIKEATGDMLAVAKIVRAAPQRFTMLQGYDEMLLPTLALGGKGGIVSLACLIPSTLVHMQQAFEQGDLTTARELQLGLLPLAEVIYSEPNPGPLKHAMNVVGLRGGVTRAPLYPIAPATVAALDRLLPAAMAEERRN